MEDILNPDNTTPIEDLTDRLLEDPNQKSSVVNFKKSLLNSQISNKIENTFGIDINIPDNNIVPMNTIEAKKLLLNNKKQEKENSIGITNDQGPALGSVPYKYLNKEQRALAIQNFKFDETRRVDASQRLEEQRIRESTALLSDSEARGFWGGLTNTGLSLVGGAANVIGNTITAGSEGFNYLQSIGITQEDVDTFKNIQDKLKTKQGLTEEDMAFVSKADDGENTYERLLNIESRQKFIDAVNIGVKSVGSWTNTKDQQIAFKRLGKTSTKAVEEFGKGDYLSSVSTFLGGLYDLAIKDPKAAVELTANSLPQMYVLAKNAILGVTTLTASGYGEAIKEFEKEYGRIPNESEKAIAGLLALASASLDAVGAKFTLGGKKLLSTLPNLAEKLGIKVAKTTLNTAKKTAKEASKNLVKKSLGFTGTVAKKIATNKLIETAIVEGSTEGAQNILDQLAGKQDLSKIDAAKVLTDTTVGAVSGVHLAAPGSAVQEASDLLSKGKTQANKGAKKFIEKAKEHNIGKAEDLVKKAKEINKPEIGIKALIDTDYSLLNSKERIKNIKDLSSFIIDLEKSYNERDNTIEDKVTQKETLLAYEQKINQIVEIHTKLNKSKSVEESIQNLESSKEDIDEKNIKSSVTNIIDSIKISTEIPVALINRLFGSDSLFTDNASDKEIKIVKDYKNYKENIERLKKSSSEVSKDILEGNEKDGFKGLTSYVSDMKKALILNSKESANTVIADINRFGKLMKQKIEDNDNRTDLSQYKKDAYRILVTSDIAAIKATKTQLINMAEGVFGKVNEKVKVTPKVKEKNKLYSAEGVNPKDATDKQLLEAINFEGIDLNDSRINNVMEEINNMYAEAINRGLIKENIKNTKDIENEDYNVYFQQQRIKNRYKLILAHKSDNPKITRYDKEIAEYKKIEKEVNQVIIELEKKYSNFKEKYNKIKQKNIDKKYSNRDSILNKKSIINNINEIWVKAIDNLKKNNDAYSLSKLIYGKTEKLKHLDGKNKLYNIIDSERIYAQQALDSLKKTKIEEKINKEEVKKDLTKKKVTKIESKKVDSSITVSEEQVQEDTNDLSKNILEGNGLTWNTNEPNKVALSDNFESKKEPKKTNVLRFIPNMFSRLLNKEIRKDILFILPTLTDIELKTLDILNNFDTKFSNTLNSIVDLLTQEQIFKNNLEGNKKGLGNPFGYLIQIDSDGKRFLNKNLITAMSMVSYNWIATQGQKTLFNDFDAIGKILGLPKGQIPSDRAIKELIHAGIPKNVLAETLGQAAYNMLGIQYKENIIDGDAEAKLILAIGENIIATLAENDLVEQTTISGSVMQLITPDYAKQENIEATSNFIKISSVSSKEDLNKLIPDKVSQFIIDSLKPVNKEKNKIMQKLFDIKVFEVHPTFEPITKVAETVKRSFMKVSDKLKDGLSKMQSVDWELDQGVLELSNFLGRKNLLKLNGYIEDIENNKHITEWESVSGKNQSIENDVDNAKAFIQTMPTITSKVYFLYEVWKNNRVGLVSSSLNPQSSKIHRHMIKASAWTTEVDTNKQRTIFKLAVAQAFGFKIEDNTIEKSVNNFDDIFKNDTIKKAITAIKASKENKKVSAEQKLEYQNDIMTAVELGKENMHTLDAINALASYSPIIKFKSSLAIEVDGKTNGVIFGLLQTMLEPNILNMLAGGSVFADNKTITNADYKNDNSTNSYDNYELLAESWNKSITTNTFLNNIIGSLVDRENNIVTDIGRKLSKSPLMTSNYNATIKRIRELFVQDVLNSFYKKLMEAKLSNDPVNNISDLVNGLMDSIRYKHINLKPEDVIKFKLNIDQEKDFINLIQDSYGKGLETALNNQFKEYSKFRGIITDTAVVMFELFNVHYQKALSEAIEKNDGNEISEKTKLEIIEKLKKVLPIIKSPTSENYDEGILLLNTDKTRDYKNDKKKIKVGFTKKIKSTNSKSATGTISNSIYTDSGLGGLAQTIQSMDSATILNLLSSDIDSLNIFDAGMFSINDVVEGTYVLNKSFAEVNEDYSIIDTFIEALERQIINSNKETLNALDKKLLETYEKASEEKQAKLPLDYIQLIDALKKLQKDIKEAKGDPKNIISAYAQYGFTDIDSVYIVQLSVDSNKSTKEQITDGVEELGDEVIKQSSSETLDFDNFQANYSKSLTADNSVHIFDDLDKVGTVKENTEHKNYLRKLLKNLVNKVISPLDSTPYKVEVSTTGAEAIGAIRGDTVKIQVGQGVIGHNVQISPQEVLVHELIHAISQYGIDSNYKVAAQLERLFNEVKKQTTWRDFLTRDSNGNIVLSNDEQVEIAAAKARYDYIFNNTKQTLSKTKINEETETVIPEYTNNYLHEFLAFGLTNEAFRNRLAQINISAKKEAIGEKLKDKFEAIFETIINWINGKVYKTTNISADQALLNLTEKLVAINDKNHKSLLEQLDFINNLNPIILNKLNSIIFAPLTNYYKSLRGKTNLHTAQKVVKNIISIPFILSQKEDRKAFFKVITQVRNNINITENSFLIKLAREVIGMTEDNIKWHNLLRYSKHYVDQARKHLADNITKDLRDSFSSKYPLTKEEKTVITKVFLKTDLSSLVNDFTVDKIINILNNSSELNSSIRKIVTELKKYKNNGNYYIRQANSLGNLIVTSKATEDNSMRNAHNIANMTSINDEILTGDLIKAEKLIDQLATLYALQLNSSISKAVLANIIEREYKENKYDNGIVKLINYHNDFKEDALKSVFNNNKSQIVKGYTSEIYNPNIDIKIASKAEEKKMAEIGYYPEQTLSKDKDDTNSLTLVMYINKNSSENTYVKSIISLTNKLAEGTDLLTAYKDAGSTMANIDLIMAMNEIQVKKTRLTKKQFNSSSINNVNDSNNYLVPIVDDLGKITGYRYLMTEANKDRLLEKNNEFDLIMGKMSASILDKVNSKKVNKAALVTAYEDYQDNFDKDPSKYVYVGKNSKDVRYREIYAMMPKDMKEDMREIWGDEGITVKEEVIDIIFGFRKLSLTESLRDTKVKYSRDDANKYAKLIADKLPLKSFYYIGLAGKIWEEVVGTAKDNIVIKSFLVLRDNIISNNFLLWAKGVPISDIYKNQLLALRAIESYQNDINKRDILQRKLKTYKNISSNIKKNLESEIAKINNRITVNPVKELIDEGIFQSIIEDIDLDENRNTYKNRLIDIIGSKTEKYLPKNITEVYKQAYMTHDTYIYKKLLKATQYSDFVARFALYQDRLTKGEKRINSDKTIKNKSAAMKLVKQQALIETIETFINYDVPTSPAMQYLNDMGIMMFTKFLFRIQKVIARQLKENPANSLALYTLQKMTGDMPDILDSFKNPFTRIQNPFFEIPDDAAYMGGYQLFFGGI